MPVRAKKGVGLRPHRVNHVLAPLVVILGPVIDQLGRVVAQLIVVVAAEGVAMVVQPALKIVDVGHARNVGRAVAVDNEHIHLVNPLSFFGTLIIHPMRPYVNSFL